MARILVVEDDPDSAVVMQRMLTKGGGHQVEVTEDAAQVVALCRAGTVDLVLMDVSLTNSRYQGEPVDGLQLTRILKGDPETAQLPVLLVTAHAMHGDRESFLKQSGADGYVVKPIEDYETLLGTLKGCLSRSGGQPTQWGKDGHERGTVESGEGQLDQIADRIHKVSTIPHFALQIVEMVHNPRSSAADLKTILETDHSLAARLLVTLNSTAYDLPAPVDRLLAAVSFVDLSEVTNLALTALIGDMFKKDVAVGSYNRNGVWQHMICVGLGARLVAARAGVENFEEAYLAGLLHDFGIVLIEDYLHEAFVEIVAGVSPKRPLWEVEQEYLGFDHTQLGARVAEHWRLPASTRAAIRYHHDSDRCDGGDKMIVQAVETANFLCSAKGLSSVGTQYIGTPSKSTLRGLSITREGFRVLWDDLDHELVKVQALINI